MKKKLKIILGLLFTYVFIQSQTHANYVRNGSFEKYSDCSPPYKIQKCLGWAGVDSISFGAQTFLFCAGIIPGNINTWQYPRTGLAYVGSTFYNLNSKIGYLRNRLKQTLKANTTYCIRFHVNIANTSPRGIDSFGAYFADSTLDTITKCNRPLVYLTPQISNPTGNIISDTLNWVAITGTFVATGNEKYMVIGNFKADAAVNTSTINGPFVAQEWTDVCIDDVSCIEMDVAAYAGPDKRFIAGDSVYLGRELDFAVDPYCMWYQLPNMSTAIDTASGIWVKPIVTTTYVVRQELECNTVKWDTVVVYKDAVGLIENEPFDAAQGKELKIWPNPAADKISVSLEHGALSGYFETIEIIDAQARVIKRIKISDSETAIEIKSEDLADGIYLLRLWDDKKENVVLKKLAVQH